MKIDTSQIINSLSMLQIIKKYVAQPINKHYIPCPFHSEKTPSLRIYDKTFYCFGCGKGGDIVRFVQQYFGIGFYEAITRLNYDFNLGMPIGEKLDTRTRAKMRREARERQKAQQAAKQEQDAAKSLYWALWDEWIRLDKNQIVYKPTSIDEPLHPLFVEAIHKKSYQEYLIDSLL